MHDFSKIQIEIDIEYSVVNSKTMDLQIICGGTSIRPSMDSQATIGVTSVQFACELPGQVTLQFSGKSYGVDTILDPQGQIAQDLYIKILRWSLDGFDLSQDFFYNKMIWHADDETTFTTPYLGKNGTLHLPFLKSNLFAQYYELEDWYDYYNLIESVAESKHSQ